MAKWMLVMMMMLAFAGLARAQEDDTVKVTKDVRYYDGDADDARFHQLDIYAPKGVSDYPVLFFVHGGAWVSGSKDEIANVGPAFAAQGIGVVIPNYRLSPAVTHPAHVEDVARALAWTMEHIAEYGGDPERIIIGGTSAGGHLTTLLVLDESYLAVHDLSPKMLMGVLPLSGAWRIDDWIMGWARGAFPDDDAGRAAASPITLVEEVDLPFLLLIAENDYPELIVEHDEMRAALTDAGVEVEAAMIAGRDHYTIVSELGSKDDEATRIMTEWMRKVFEREAE